MQSAGWVLMLGLCALAIALPLRGGHPAPGAAEPGAPEVGKKHPDFTLPRIDTREQVSLSQFRGKKVLLIQFASW